MDYTLSEHSGRFVGWDLGARDGKVGRTTLNSPSLSLLTDNMVHIHHSVLYFHLILTCLHVSQLSLHIIST